MTTLHQYYIFLPSFVIRAYNAANIGRFIITQTHRRFTQLTVLQLLLNNRYCGRNINTGMSMAYRNTAVQNLYTVILLLGLNVYLLYFNNGMKSV